MNSRVGRLCVVISILCALVTPGFAAEATGVALVRHAPSINGTVDGSVQQMLPESVTLNGGAVVTGNLLVPGTPNVRLNGQPTYGGTLNGTGASSPSNYQVTLNGNARLNHVVRRTNAVALPGVSAPPSPTGTRTVNINSAGQSAGNFATLRHLTLNGNVGQYAIPPGTYGDFTANGGSGFTLGVAGATQPAVYNFQRLTLNGQTQVQVLGPVVITVANGFSANGALGSSANPSRLTLNVYSGGFTLNGGCSVYGYVNAPNGTVIINGNSQLIGGVTSDRLIVNGGGLLRAQAPVASNQSPIAHHAALSVTEDASATVTLSATDPDGQTLTYSVVAHPEHGTLSGSAPNLTYTPALNYSGPDGFTFKANDGQADSNVATVSVTVTPIPDRPVAQAKTLELDEDTPSSVVLSGTDADGDPLTFNIVGDPAHGTLSGTGAARTYMPAQNYFGSDTFTYVASDGSLTSAPATVSITVHSLPDRPVALPAAYSVNEGATVAITLTGADADGDALTFTRLSLPSNGTLSGAAPNFTYQPNANFGGTDSFTFTASDGTLTSDPATITIQAVDLNFPPVAQNVASQTDEDTAKTLTLSATDQDGDGVTFSIVSGPTKGALGAIAAGADNTATVVYTPNLNASGNDSFTFKANDGKADSAVATVAITIHPVNDAPEAEPQAVGTDEDQNVAIVLTASDVESSPLTFAIVSDPATGTLGPLSPGSNTTAHVTYTPAADANGIVTFTFKANDGEKDSAPSTVTINVRAINDPPVAAAEPATTPEDVARVITLTATDTDSPTVTFAITTQPAHGTLGEITPISSTRATVPYTPAPDYHGDDSFVFVAADEESTSAPVTVGIVISPVNDAPVAADQSVTFPENGGGTLTLGATDPENEPLTYTYTQPAHGTVSGTAPNLTYTPQPFYVGTDGFTFRASDLAPLESNEATVSITVFDVNTPPTADDQTFTLDEDGVQTFQPDVDDAENDALTYTVIDVPDHGSLGGVPPGPVATLPTITYTPAANYHGLDSFTYEVNDGNPPPARQATVTFNIQPINDPPVADPQALTTAEDVALSIALTGGDAENSVLSFALVAQPTRGTLSGTAPNLVYTPDANTHGDDAFSFKVSDGALESVAATVAISVTPVNDPPVAQDLTVLTTENIPAAVTLSATDIDDNVLTFITNAPAHGTLSGMAPNFTYTPNPDYYGPDSFTFSARDTALAESNTATVTITVKRANQPPVALAQAVETTPNSPLPITLAATDVNDDPLTYTIVAQPRHGALSGTPPNVIYTPAEGFAGFDVFTFRANDPTTSSADASVAITISLAEPCATAQPIQPVGGSPEFSSREVTATLIGWDEYSPVSSPPRKYRKQTSNQFFYHLNSDIRDGCISFPYGSTRIEVHNATSTYAADTGARTTTGVRQYGGNVVHGGSLQTLYEGPLTSADSFHDADAPRSQVMSTQLGFRPPELTPTTAVKHVTAECFLSSNGQNHLYLNGQISWTLSEEDTEADALQRAAPVLGTSNTAYRAKRTTGFSFGSSEVSYEAAFNIPSSGTYYVYSTYRIKPHGQPGPVATHVVIGTREFEAGEQVVAGDIEVILDNYDYTLESVVVRPPCTPPVAHDQSLIFARNAAKNITLAATDSDGDALTFDVVAGPTHGTLTGTAPNLTYVPATDYVGTDSFTFRAFDGGAYSNVATVSLKITLPNSPPVIVSRPNTLHMLAAATGPQQVMDLGTFQIVNYVEATPAPPQWVIFNQRKQARQLTNSDPTILLSPHYLQDGVVEGYFSVETSVDDDFIGFVFGYQDSSHYYLFDWKQSFQDEPGYGIAQPGMSVKLVDSTTPIAPPDLWKSAGVTNKVRTLYRNSITYSDFTTYKFILRFRSGEFTIAIYHNGKVIDSFTIQDATFNAGLFGFYNMSQEMSFFHGMLTQRLPSSDYLYPIRATDADGDAIAYSLVDGPIGVTVDATTGRLAWPAGMLTPGHYPIVVRATDAIGYSADQSYVLTIDRENMPPVVLAGADRFVPSLNTSITLTGSNVDDGAPLDGTLTSLWRKIAGPGEAAFGTPTNTVSTVSFDQAGIYVLELEGDDSALKNRDRTEVRAALSYPKAAPAGLAAWWPANGTLEEKVKGTPDLQLQGDAALGAGHVSQAFVFDGTEDFGVIPAAEHMDVAKDGAFSAEWWLRSEATAFQYHIKWWNGAQPGVEVGHDTLLYMNIRDTSGGSHIFRPAMPAQPSAWHHYAVTYDRATSLARMYVDGNMVFEQNIGSFTPATAGDLFVGTHDGRQYFLRGGLDELSLYTRALRPEEIHAIFSAGTAGKSPVNLHAPIVDAGPDVALRSISESVQLAGIAQDDEHPGPLQVRWRHVSGPGTALFGDEADPDTSVTFSAPGLHTLELSADDTFARSADTMVVRIGSAGAEPAEGLRLWWPTNDHPREVVREVSNLELFNGAGYSVGAVSNGLRLDGVNDYARVRASAETNLSAGNFTVELWMKPDVVKDAAIIQWDANQPNGSGFAIWMEAANSRLGVYSGSTAVLANGAAQAGVWSHVAVTYVKSAGRFTIYRDGLPVSTGTVPANFTPRMDIDVFLGWVPRYAGSYSGFAGVIDEVSVYARALSEAEIVGIYQAGGNGKTPPDDNAPPLVFAGPDRTAPAAGAPVTLEGVVLDDDLPFGPPSVEWSVLTGQNGVQFADKFSANTTATFPAPGMYVLQLIGTDFYTAAVSDVMEVRVGEGGVDTLADLVAWWPGNGSNEERVNQNDAGLIAGTHFSPGHVAMGFEFDGVDDYVKVPADADLNLSAGTAGFSAEFWVKPDVVRDTAFLQWDTNQANGSGFSIWMEAANSRIGVYSGGPAVLANGAAQANVWSHIAVTYAKPSGLLKIYRNGAIVASGNLGANFAPRTDYDLYFGAVPRYAGLYPWFDGMLDEVSLYRRPLTDAEVLAIYSAGTDGKKVGSGVTNTAPIVSAGGGQSVHTNSPVLLRGVASDDGLPNPPGALTVAWSQVSGPAGAASFGNASELVTTVTFTAPGTYTLRLTASDSALTRSQDATYVVTTPPSEPPTIAIVAPADGSTLLAGEAFTIRATATAPAGTVTKVEFYRGATKIGEDFTAPYQHAVTAGLPPGNFTLAAKVTDSLGVAVATEVAVTVVADTGEPVVRLDAPGEDARITAPVLASGVALSDQLASWTLSYRLKAAEGEVEGAWTTAITGSTPVGTAGATEEDDPLAGELGSFDPTLLLNGIYELQLAATDTFGRTTSTPPFTVLVEGNMKIGAFSLAFEDLKVPVAGIPISIMRTYDSRDARVGDFGPGWRIALNNIRVQKNRTLGREWLQSEVFYPQDLGLPRYRVEPASGQRLVTIAMPDGETHRFRLGVLVKKRFGDPDNESLAVIVHEGEVRFYPVGDTTAQLEPIDENGNALDRFWMNGVGANHLLAQEPEFGDDNTPLYDASRFRLTSSDGTVFILDEKLGLLQMRDLNGNTLVLDRDLQDRVTGVTSTQNLAPEDGGPRITSITIHRDATGRVDYIRDPNDLDLDYIYDSEGRLESFVDRESNVTQFRYDNAAFPHYLTQIIDPRGITALRSEYDPVTGKLSKQIDAEGNETVFNRGIDGTGRFEKIKDRLGHETTFYYDERGNVTLKIDPLGAQTSYSYYPDSDRVKFEIDHYGNAKSMAYDARGNVTAETVGASTAEDPANPTTGYTTHSTYNDNGAAVLIADPSGRLQSFVYDPEGNNLLSYRSGPDGSPAMATFAPNEDGSLESTTDALGNVTSYAHLYSFSDADYPGAIKQITVTITDPAGAAGSDPSNATATVLRTSRTMFDAQENRVAEVTARTLPGGTQENVITRYAYDSENRIKATFLPDGRVTETRYNALGKIDQTLLWRNRADYDSADASRARVTIFGYDSRGNQTSIVYADGTGELAEFDAENRKIWSQDRRGLRTHFEYDKVGRLRFVILPDTTPDDLSDNPRTETVYDLIGRVTDTYDELRRRTQTVYFPDGSPDSHRRKHLIQVRATGNLVTTYEYDAAGNVRYVTDPRGNRVETRYDENGRQTHVILEATDEHPVTQTETKYDPLGRRIEVIDQEGKVSRLRYDALGRVVETRQYADQSVAASDADFTLSPDAAGVISTRYAYDELGAQISQTDALGRTTAYENDHLRRRTKRILPKEASEPSAPSETLAYDEWGNLWKRTDFAGKTTTFAYDVLNRLKSKTADPTHPSLGYGHAIAHIEYDYDANGARIAARVFNASDVELYVETTPRDERGRIEYKDTAGGRLDYSYYENNLLKDVVSSNAGGVNVGYRYDELNRLESVDDTSTGLPTRTTGYTYNPNGSLETISQPNGVVHTYGYDALNRLRGLVVARGATLLHSYEYKLRASGHRREAVEGARTITYSYDDLYRLRGESRVGDPNGNNGDVTYELDKVGNRLARISSLAPVQNQHNSYNARDWLDSDSYNANGSTVGAVSLDGPVSDAYDFEERLIVRTKPDGTSINLLYDADGYRIAKHILDPAQLVSSTNWLVDTNNLTGYAQVFEERRSNGAGTTRTVYTYGSDLLSQATSSTESPAPVIAYYAYDGHGSTRELTDAAGAVTDRYDYDAFGNLLFRSGSTANAYLFTGEQFDGDLGLYYLRARYVNQSSGRFWSMDSYEGSRTDPLSLHKYLYASANPVSFIDPSGHFSLAEVANNSIIVGIFNALATFYSPLAIANRIATTWLLQGYVLELTLRYAAGMKMAIDEVRTILNTPLDWVTLHGATMAVDEIEMRVLKEVIRGLPQKSLKAALFGPFGVIISLITAGTQIGELIDAETKVLNGLVKTYAGLVFTLAFNNVPKAARFAAEFALMAFSPERIIFDLGDYVYARRNGNAVGAAYSLGQMRQYIGRYTDL